MNSLHSPEVLQTVESLEAKTRCVEKFYEISLEFLSYLENSISPDFIQIDAFSKLREGVIKAMDLYDRRIDSLTRGLEAIAVDKTSRERMRLALQNKDFLIPKILDLDLKLIGHLERLKAEVHRSLVESRSSKTKITKFKSSWMPEHGEGLDTKL